MWKKPVGNLCLFFDSFWVDYFLLEFLLLLGNVLFSLACAASVSVCSIFRFWPSEKWGEKRLLCRMTQATFSLRRQPKHKDEWTSKRKSLKQNEGFLFLALGLCLRFHFLEHSKCKRKEVKRDFSAILNVAPNAHAYHACMEVTSNLFLQPAHI